jgi:hypothetical protein
LPRVKELPFRDLYSNQQLVKALVVVHDKLRNRAVEQGDRSVGNAEDQDESWVRDDTHERSYFTNRHRAARRRVDDVARLRDRIAEEFERLDISRPTP